MPTAATEAPGRLKLVTPSESEPARGARAAGPAAECRTQGRRGRCSAAAQESETKRLLELKNQELARMQAQGGQARARPRPPRRRPRRPRRPTRRAGARGSPAGGQHRTAADRAGSGGGGDAGTPPPAPVKKTPVKAPPSGGSFLDTLLGLWWVVALLALGVLGFFAARLVRSRRSSEFDDSLGRLAAAGA